MDHTIPVISMRSSDCAAAFTDSLRHFGFAALSDHPLDMSRVNSIYEQWLAFFQMEEKFAYPFDEAEQDGYFGLQDAESAKGSLNKISKNTFITTRGADVQLTLWMMSNPTTQNPRHSRYSCLPGLSSIRLPRYRPDIRSPCRP